MNQDFAQDLQEIIRLLDSGERFAFSRFGDGEYLICNQIPARVDKPTEHWVSGAEIESFSKKLNLSLTEPQGKNFYLGLMCPCCDKISWAWFCSQVPISPRITFATLFTNANYEVWHKYCQTSDLRRRSLLVSSAGGDFPVPRNAVNTPWGLDQLVTDLLAQADKPILVAAGPASNIIIHQYWSRGGGQAVVDIGSSLDPELHGIETRSYQLPDSECSRKVCQWRNPDV